MNNIRGIDQQVDSLDSQKPEHVKSTKKINPDHILAVNASNEMGGAATPHHIKLMAELDHFLAITENEVEQNISALGVDIELIDASVNVELITQSYPRIASGVISNVADLFNAVVPPFILELSAFGQVVSVTKEISSLGSVLLASLDNGTRFVGIVCKHKMIKQSRILLEKLRKAFQEKLGAEMNSEKGPKMTPETIQRTQELFASWEKNLKTQASRLKKEKKELTLSSTFTFAYIALEAIHLSKLTGFISNIASVGTQVIIFAINEFEFIKALLNSSKLENWQKAYAKWQTKQVTVVDKRIDTDFNQTLLPSEQKEVELMNFIPHDLYEIDVTPVDFQTSMNILDHIIKTSKNLLHKRQAIARKKHLLISRNYEEYKSKIKESNRKLFHSALAELERTLKNLETPRFSEEMENVFNRYIFFSEERKNEPLQMALDSYKSALGKGIQTEIVSAKDRLSGELAQRFQKVESKNELFEKWFLEQSRENLTENYINHQEIFETTLKSSLNQLIKEKQELESKFLRLHKYGRGVILGASLLGIASGLAVIITGVITAPAGIGVLILLASLGPAAAVLGHIAMSYLYQLYKKPHTAKALTYPPRLSFNRIGKAFYSYRENLKKKKVWESAKFLREMLQSSSDKQNDSKLKKAMNNYRRAKADYEISKMRFGKWSKDLTKLEREYAEKGWKDFVAQSSLIPDSQAFNSLQAFNQALINCDLSLLSRETKVKLELMGINLKVLQPLISQDPQAISFALQQYTSITHDQLINFIDRQEA